MINNIIYILIGTASALFITYIILIRKFYKFINNEIEQNAVYRENAENDYKNAFAAGVENNDS